jgi:ribonucleoside-diphosphate reductase alpha chain
VKGTANTMHEEKKETKASQEPRKRPHRLSGFTEKIETSCGTLYVTINWNEEGKPFEVFTRIGKAGGCASSQSEALGRLISMALRSGIEPKYIVKQLRGITCHLPRGMGENKVSSCADAAAQVLENVFMEDEDTTNPQAFVRGACPECQGPIEQSGGCSVCRQCGYSDCG